MVAAAKPKRPRSVSALPGKFIRSRSGSVARVCRTTTPRRDREDLLRLTFLLQLDDGRVAELRSNGLMTADELTTAGVRWFRRCPRRLPRLASAVEPLR